MSINRAFLWGAIVGSLSIPSTAFGQDPAIDALRPITIYAEDFESFAEGGDDYGGVALDPRYPWLRDPGAGKIASSIPGEFLPSKQLVIADGKFTWRSEWITVEPNRLLHLSVDLISAPSGLVICG